MLKALIVYWSGTGNTEKVAHAIKRGLESELFKVTIKKPEEAADDDLFIYDLVCFGSPSHQWLPAMPIREFVNVKLREAFLQGHIKPGLSPVPGRNALVFITYSGTHTGKNEAIPAAKWLGQFFEHIGFTVVDELYVVGEFHGRLIESTQGRLGDIRGKPSKEDLVSVEEKAAKLASSL
jgi:hypothetical protein